MTGNTELLYWRENKDFYVVDKTQKCGYRIKDNAPDRAKKSFKIWLEYLRKHNCMV